VDPNSANAVNRSTYQFLKTKVENAYDLLDIVGNIVQYYGAS